jgi:hypothetical protein
MVVKNELERWARKAGGWGVRIVRVEDDVGGITDARRGD